MRVTMNKAVSLLSVAILIALLPACPLPGPTPGPSPSGTAPTADYGDAPDAEATGYPTLFAQTGSFPTRFDSDGARVLDTSIATLGATASQEVDATDPADPDGLLNLVNADSDDGITDLVLALTAIPPPASLSVAVAAPDNSPGGTFHLNVLIDLNMDGVWGGSAAGNEPEWVAQNVEITVTPGDTLIAQVPPFAFANGLLLPDGAWMRIALTQEAITADDWDGTGEFSAGEIEDHVILLPEKPILVVACAPAGRITVPPPPPALPITCTVSNLHPTVAGQFDWRLARISGFGIAMEDPTVPVTSQIQLSGNNIAIAAAGPTGGAAGSVVSLPSGAPVPPGGAGLNAHLVAGPLGLTGCTWRLTAFPDPDAVITSEGVTLGHGEVSCDIPFAGEEFDQALPPTVEVEGETESVEFHHDYTDGSSACTEQIATFAVANAGGGTLEWSIGQDAVLQDWLTVSPTSGIGPTDVTLTFDCSGIFGVGGLNNFTIVGSDPDTGESATNEVVVSVTWGQSGE
jgi:hypothetical protein